MKKVLLTVLSAMAVSLTAQEQVITNARSLTEEFLREIARISHPDSSFEYVTQFLEKHGLSEEQVAKIMEHTIRENLHILEAMERPDFGKLENEHLIYAYRDAETNVTRYMIMLRVFQSPDTLTLLEECVQSKSEKVRSQATPVRNTVKFRTTVHGQLAEDDAALKSFILSAVCNPGEPSIYLQQPSGVRPRSAQNIAMWYKIPAERMTRVLEEITRERLSNLEQAEGDKKAHPQNDVAVLLKQFRYFHGVNTLALLNECAQSESERVRKQAKATLEFINANETERKAMAVEEIIREGLSDMETADERKKSHLRQNIYTMLQQLKDFQSPNTLELLRECIVSKDDGIQCNAVLAYVEITRGEGDAVDFLRKVYTEGRFLDMGRHEISRFLGGDKYTDSFLAELKAKNKNDNVEKFLALMFEMVQTEQHPGIADQMDGVLCRNLDGYAQSIQRAQIVQKFVNSTYDWVRNRFGEIKAEIDKIPADQRTDLSQRFKLPPAPQ